MTLNFKPLKIMSASEQVASRLRTAIISGQIKEGDVLNLHELSEVFGVSNTPVRAAIQSLAADGLIMLRPNKGAVVIGMSAKRIRDYYQVRIILESGAAELACQVEDQGILIAAFEAAEKCIREEKWEEYSTYNRHFHQAIWELCDNDRMFDILSSLWNTSSRPRYSTEKEYVLYSHEEHRRIYDAIRQQDPESAKREMQDHLKRSLKDILTYYEEDPAAEDQGNSSSF